MNQHRAPRSADLTHLTLSLPVGLGTNTFARTTDAETSLRVLDAFTACGGTLIDTADTYSDGASETIIGGWLRSRRNRDQILLCTKGGNHLDSLGLSAAAVTAACEASLGRLATDHIDLYFAHYQDDETPIEESVAAYDGLVRRGKIRAYGLSNFSADAIRAWLDTASRNQLIPPVALQPHYSLVHRGAYEHTLRPIVEQHHLAVLPYRALGGGFLTGKYRTMAHTEGRARGAGVRSLLVPEGFHLLDVLAAVADELDVTTSAVALAWLIHQPHVLAPLTSATSRAQLDELLPASDLPLSPDHLQAITAASRPFAEPPAQQ